MKNITNTILNKIFCVGVLSIICSFMLTSCGDEAIEEESYFTQEQLASLEDEIITLIGEAECTDINQCQSIGFGSKPCGGHWEYLVYSTMNTDALVLEEKVLQYNVLEEDYNNENDIVSTCDIVLIPEVTCNQGKCEIK